MKVKELVDILIKENQESDIHIQVDQDITGDDDFGWIHAKGISIEGHKKMYQYRDCYRDEADIEEHIQCDSDDELNDEELSLKIKSLENIEGVFIRISP